MSPWLVSLVVSATLLAQTDAPPAESSPKVEIRRAIKQLASSDFATRDQAYKLLWKQGLKAEPALRQAAKSIDGETRLRAKRLLRDFEYGILPGVDAEVIVQIRRFRDGAAAERQVAFQQLLDGERFEVLEQLIRLERDPSVRQTLLHSVVQHNKAIERFVESGQIETLIEAIGADQDENWRRSATIALKFAPKMIERHAEKGELDTLLTLIHEEGEPARRTNMVQLVFRSSTTVAKLIEEKQLPFIFDVLRAEPDKKVRGTMLSGVASSSAVGQAIVATEQLDTVLTFIEKEVHVDTRHVVLGRFLQSQPIVQAVMQDGGLDSLLKLVAREKDAGSRGRLLASILSSSAFRNSANRNQLAEVVVELAKKQSDPKARREFLRALLENYTVVYALSSGNKLKPLWDLIKNDEDDSWKPEAVALLFRTHYAYRLLQEKEEATWVLKLIRETKTQATREQLLGVLLGNYQAHESLLKEGHFDTLLALAVDLPQASRGRILGGFLSSRAVAQHLMAQKRMELFIELPRDEEDPPTRQAYLQGIFRNYTAMPELIKAGHYKAFRDLIDRETDVVRRVSLFGYFLAGRDVVTEVEKQGDIPRVLEYAALDNQAAKKQFLNQLFRNQLAMGLLVDKGHYEKLASIAKENDSEFMDELLSVPKVIEHLVANEQVHVLFDFATKRADDNARRNMVRAIIYNQQLMKKLLDAGQFEGVFALVRSEKDPNWRGSLLGPALSSPELLRHLVIAKKLASVFELISKEPEERVRHQVLSQLAGRSDAVAILVEHGHLERLLQLVKGQTTGRTRGDLLGRVVTSQKTLEYIAGEGKQTLLLSLAQDQDQESAAAFATRMFNNSRAVALLVDDGHYDVLFRLATGAENPTIVASRISRLFANSKALQQLIARQELGGLIKLAKDVEDASARRTYLASFCQNEAIVEQLITQDLFDDLLAICRSDPDATIQRRNLATLLFSGKAMDELSKLGQLKAILKDAIEDPDQRAQQTWLSSLLRRSDAVNGLLKHGHFERVMKLAEQRLNDSTKSSIFRSLLSNPKTIDFFATDDRIELLWGLLENTSRASERPYLVSRFASNPKLMKLIVERDQLQRLLDELKHTSSSSYRASLMGSILFSSATLEALAAKGKLGLVFEQVKEDGTEAFRRRCLQAFAYYTANRRHLADSELAEQFIAVLKEEDERYRAGYAMQLIGDAYLRRKWVAAGKVKELQGIIALIPQESRRRAYRRTLLFSPSGVLGDLLRRGKFAEAEGMAMDSEDDAGLSAYVTLQVVRGQLDQTLAAVRQRYDADATPADARLLVYLYRAAGDSSAAREIAEKLNDPQLLRPLYVEQHAWREAAALEAESHRPSPVPASTVFVDTDDSLRIEQLGLLAAYQRRAGMAEELAATIKAIQEFADAHKENGDLVWYAAEALLLNDRFDEGIQLTASAKIDKAFTLLTMRHEYQRAFELVGLGEGETPDREWYDSLPTIGRTESEQKQKRFDFAVRIAQVEKHLGRLERARQVVAMLEEFIKTAPTSGNSPTRATYEDRLAGGLYRMGWRDLAWKYAAKTHSPTASYAPNVMNTIYGTRAVEAQAWWLFFRHRFAEEDLVACFNRVDLALNPAPDEVAGDYATTLKDAMAFAESLQSDSQRASCWRGFGQTSRMRGLNDSAIECLQHVAGSQATVLPMIADLQAAEERWQEAAGTYRSIWEDDHDQLGALYLAGDAAERAGDVEQGKAWKAEANLLAIRSRTRHTMSVALANRGLMDEAVAQWELLLKTAPLEAWELNDAARRIGDRCFRDDPKRAADLWEHYVLGDLRPAFWFLKDESYLRMPFVIHKARAAQAIKNGDLETASHELGVATAAAPSDTRLAEELVPMLDQAAHKADADRLTSTVVEHYAKMSKAFPESAYFHNNLAWVAARCHRQLDLAMQHAERATALEQNNGSYVDTLAEVHFRLGDRLSAVRESERAVRLSPFQSSLRQQLKRFRDDPLP